MSNRLHQMAVRIRDELLELDRVVGGVQEFGFDPGSKRGSGSSPGKGRGDRP